METLPPIASRMLAVLLLLFVFAPAPGQDAARKERERREKFETILRIQDSRSPVKGALQRALADPDPLVRDRAVLACASLQDSSLLDLLTRLLEDPAVSSSAAFAIGQTGAALSPAGRQRLENDLLWNRLRSAADVTALLTDSDGFAPPPDWRRC